VTNFVLQQNYGRARLFEILKIEMLWDTEVIDVLGSDKVEGLQLTQYQDRRCDQSAPLLVSLLQSGIFHALNLLHHL
jgi:uncharacterized membrane protein YiaA